MEIFPNIRQLGPVWCGPTALEAIFRYFGVNSRNLFGTAGITDHYLWQSNLATLLGTAAGTTAQNVHSFLNDRNQFFGGHDWHIQPICASDLDYDRFYGRVYYSLQSNIPVIMAYHGSSGNFYDKFVVFFLIISL